MTFGVRSVVAEVTVSAVLKLAREIDESTSVIVVYGMVSRSLVSLGKPTAESLCCVVPGEGWVYGLVDEHDSHEQGTEIQHSSQERSPDP